MSQGVDPFSNLQAVHIPGNGDEGEEMLKYETAINSQFLLAGFSLYPEAEARIA